MQEQFPDADIEAKYKELRAEYGSARKVREALEAEYGQRLSPDVVNRYSPDSFYTYTQLRKIINQSGLSIKGAGFEVHHLLEKQFARLFNIKVGDIISTPLTPLWHRGVKGEKIVLSGNNIDNLITHELCRIMGIDNSDLAKQSASAKQVWEAHRNIYESIGHEDWANAIYEAYVEQLNIDY